jgi:hypothetical protein
MVTAARLYYQAMLLAAGPCSMGPDHRPTWGTITALAWQDWLFGAPLTLRLQAGRRFRIRLLTAEQISSGQYLLTFDIQPPAP